MSGKFTRDYDDALAKHMAHTGAKLVNYTIDFQWDDEPALNRNVKCMAPNWLKALNLGLRDLCGDKDLDIQRLNPSCIKIERK